MRTIKFRYWDLSEKKMVYFELSNAYEIPVKILKLYPIMQFTGLLDKNGKEIYEGDVVKSGNGRIWAVEFGYWIYTELRQESNQYGFFLRGGDNTISITGSPYGEIIGGIYSTPSLIK